MATAKDQLHEIVDRLSEERVEDVLAVLSRELEAEALQSRARKTGTVLVSGRAFFSAPAKTWRELAAEQGVSPVASVDELIGDFWPED